MSKVIAVGLDSAEPRVIERWMAEGKLPNMQEIKEEGLYTRLDNYEESNTETSWTTFATGRPPEETGYFGPLVYNSDSYRMVTKAAYDYKKYPPFFALGKDYRVISFDVPQVRLNPNVNGIQIAAWGAHSPQVEQGSLPENVMDGLHRRYGPHPGLHRDYACVGNFEKTMDVQKWLQEGIKLRGQICIDFIKEQEWDLMLAVFGEAHPSMHTCWHMSQEDHPLYERFKKRLNSRDPMLETFQLMDEAIGNMRKAAPEDTHFVVFSLNGMGPAFMDLSSMVFLPEYLYRYNFPGKQALGDERTTHGRRGDVVDYDFDFWERHIWNTKYEPNLIKRAIKKLLPNRLYMPIAQKLDPVKEDDLIPFFALNRTGDPVGWIPAHWYRQLWPKMKAFATPSFGEGYVRINVKGRDPSGQVAPEDYDAVCEEIIQMVSEIRDAADNEKIVDRVVRTRSKPHEQDREGHFADLIVILKDKCPPNKVTHPDLGSIGPLPRYRSGTHRCQGMFLGCGEDIKTALQGTHVLDVAPTILRLLGAEVPAYMNNDGSMTERKTA